MTDAFVILRKRVHRASRWYRCDECSRHILEGDTYTYQWIADRERLRSRRGAFAARICMRCGTQGAHHDL